MDLLTQNIVFFQYDCCLKYDIRRQRTAHLFSHYVNIGYEDFLVIITKFAADNMQWIQKVGGDHLRRSKLTVQDFVKGILNRTNMFNELCITVACRTFNIHCVILLEGSFWCTRPNNDFTDCLLKICYVGDFGFKELCEETALIFDEWESKDSDSLSDLDEDLHDTGLFGSNSENDDAEDEQQTDDQDQLDVKPIIRLPCVFTTTVDNPIVLSDDEQMDVKPDLTKLKVNFTTTENEPIVLSDSDDEHMNVKPPIPAKCSFTTSPDEAIQLSGDDAEDQNVPQLATGKRQKKQIDRVKRDRNYSCYICGTEFEKQGPFVTHHYDQHPNDQFKCEFCDKYFESANGLFKHQRSHLYMKHTCPDCKKFFQFPYQLKAHRSQHTGMGKHQCGLCEKSFGANCSKDFHEKTHGGSIKCDLCPISTEKIFTNTIALHIHQ